MSLDFEIYHNPNSAKQVANVHMFRKISDRYDWIDFSQPNPDVAPWHIVGLVRYNGGSPIILNFWPHKGKAQREDCQSVQGYDAIRELISECIEDSQDELDVIE